MLNLDKVIIAHRGASGYAPENTLAAFEKARMLGCRWIEFDVMLSADKEAFVFHDEVLNRTTNGRGRFEDTDSETLKTLDAGRWFSKQFQGEPIPTLQTALNWLILNDMQANIEIKPVHQTIEETTITVLSLLNRYWPKNKPWPLLSSFAPEALALCQSIAPEMPLGLLMDTWQDNWFNMARELKCFSIHVNQRALTKARVWAIKEQGYILCVYTVNRKRQARKWFDWGVDALFSDYPDLW